MKAYGRPPETHCAGCSRGAAGAHPPKARARQEGARLTARELAEAQAFRRMTVDVPSDDGLDPDYGF
jgi:hypothetical protein